MNVEMQIVVTDVYQAEKRHYISGVVMGGAGGMIKFSVEGQAKPDLVPGKTFNFNGVFKPGIGKSGLYLEFLGK